MTMIHQQPDDAPTTPTWDYCPAWCIEDNEPVLSTRAVPLDGHDEAWHSSGSTAAGRRNEGRVYARLVQKNVHLVPPPFTWRDREPFIEISGEASADDHETDEELVLVRLESAHARALAAHLIHLADLADDLPVGHRP